SCLLSSCERPRAETPGILGTDWRRLLLSPGLIADLHMLDYGIPQRMSFSSVFH
uniref:Uncharacterized protein n=1 Tax=Peromyscus maniculatus bairdii TaxID=230844 RepID=A0A8C8UIV1_PERMB